MKLYASEDEAYQIRIGREIVAAYPEIYNPWVVDHIKREEFEQFIGYKPDKEYWWQRKYPSRFDNIK